MIAVAPGPGPASVSQVLQDHPYSKFSTSGVDTPMLGKDLAPLAASKLQLAPPPKQQVLLSTRKLVSVTPLDGRK